MIDYYEIIIMNLLELLLTATTIAKNYIFNTSTTCDCESLKNKIQECITFHLPKYLKL